jgi:hypothetical protein
MCADSGVPSLKRLNFAREAAGDVVEEDYGYVIDSGDENSDEEEKDDKDLGEEDGEEP